MQDLAKSLGITLLYLPSYSPNLNLIERLKTRGHGVIMISHNMEDVRAVADRIVVLRLGRNNGVFTPESSNAELVGAITGATDNAVSRRAARREAEAQEARP